MTREDDICQGCGGSGYDNDHEGIRYWTCTACSGTGINWRDVLFRDPPYSVMMNILTSWCAACALETSGWCGGCENCLMIASPIDHICGAGPSSPLPERTTP